jgi:hypothetical protein
MLKNSVIFVLILVTSFVQSKESYNVVPSVSLVNHTRAIDNILADINLYVKLGDFYLTDIARIIYYLTAQLAKKNIFIEMKGMWREQTGKNTYVNHLYIYYAWENPRHDPC